jgi:hypothetical protein
VGCGGWGRTAVLAGSLAVGLRLPFVHDLPYTDEGGLLVVADHWHTGGPYLYGPLFVDRPPLLLAFFRLADDLGGVVSLRLLGLGLVAVAVACATRAGTLLGGTRGAVAASLTCAALLADPLLGTREVDAETVGVPWCFWPPCSLWRESGATAGGSSGSPAPVLPARQRFW